MTKRNIIIKKKNGSIYDELYPITTASNVVLSNGDTVESQLGDMTQVPTTSKTASGAITELFTDVDNGKNAISGAITDVDSNVVIPANPTFGDLVSAIGGISTGKKWASGEVILNITQINFEMYSGTLITRFPLSITGLTFKPSVIIIKLRGSNEASVTLYDKNMTNAPITLTINRTSPTVVSAEAFKLTAGAVVTSNSFTMPVFYNNGTYDWIAIE